MPDITTNHAITYTNVKLSKFYLASLAFPDSFLSSQ